MGAHPTYRISIEQLIACAWVLICVFVGNPYNFQAESCKPHWRSMNPNELVTNVLQIVGPPWHLICFRQPVLYMYKSPIHYGFLETITT